MRVNKLTAISLTLFLVMALLAGCAATQKTAEPAKAD